MIAADFVLEGADPGLSLKLEQALLAGLKLGGEHVLKLARDRVPIEEGTLERSGATSDDGRATVAVSFDTPYAVRQHEDMAAHHDDGRQAKYLETAAAEAAPDVGKLVAAAVQQVTGKGAA